MQKWQTKILNDWNLIKALPGWVRLSVCEPQTKTAHWPCEPGPQRLWTTIVRFPSKIWQASASNHWCYNRCCRTSDTPGLQVVSTPGAGSIGATQSTITKLKKFGFLKEGFCVSMWFWGESLASPVPPIWSLCSLSAQAAVGIGSPMDIGYWFWLLVLVHLLLLAIGVGYWYWFTYWYWILVLGDDIGSFSTQNIIFLEAGQLVTCSSKSCLAEASLRPRIPISFFCSPLMFVWERGSWTWAFHAVSDETYPVYLAGVSDGTHSSESGGINLDSQKIPGLLQFIDCLNVLHLQSLLSLLLLCRLSFFFIVDCLQLRKLCLYISILGVQLSEEVRRLLPPFSRISVTNSDQKLTNWQILTQKPHLGGGAVSWSFCICFMWASAASSSLASTELSWGVASSLSFCSGEVTCAKYRSLSSCFSASSFIAKNLLCRSWIECSGNARNSVLKKNLEIWLHLCKGLSLPCKSLRQSAFVVQIRLQRCLKLRNLHLQRILCCLKKDYHLFVVLIPYHVFSFSLHVKGRIEKFLVAFPSKREPFKYMSSISMHLRITLSFSKSLIFSLAWCRDCLWAMRT